MARGTEPLLSSGVPRSFLPILFAIGLVLLPGCSGGGGSTGPTTSAPTISSQPTSQTVLKGATATFAVSASGTPSPTYQWRRSGQNLAGQTASSLAIANAAASDEASYDVVVANSAGTVLSNSAALTVEWAPTFTTHPASLSVTAPNPASFTATVDAKPTCTYQWQSRSAGGSSWSEVSGEVAATLTIAATTAAMNGSQYRCAASNSRGQATSTPATLSVNLPSLQLINTYVVMPDADYHNGGFVRINYLPTSDRFLVTFAAASTASSGGTGYVYKEYTPDMVWTGRSGRFLWDYSGDMGSVLVGNTYYFVTFPLFADGPNNGWRVRTYDATTMQKQLDQFVGLPGNDQMYAPNDPMVAWVNGRLDVSGQYNPSGRPPNFTEGTGTYHHFFDGTLQSLGERTLTDTPHIGGSSMVYVNGVYHLVSAKAFLGADLAVMKYDANWQFLGSKNLGLGQAHWSTGVVFDGSRFYVAYLDNSKWAFPAPKIFPIYLDAHLAVFDANWNLLADVAATNFSAANSKAAGRPWVMLHNKRLYLAYDVDVLDPTKVPAEQFQGQAWITVYDLIEQP